jgi:hypothetical protein
VTYSWVQQLADLVLQMVAAVLPLLGAGVRCRSPASPVLAPPQLEPDLPHARKACKRV